MLRILVTLLGCVFAADACLQCDRRVRVLHEQLALSAQTLEKQFAITMITNRTYESYIEISRERKGVIDFTSMYRACTEYLNEFRLFMQSHHSGPFEASQIMRKSKRILEKHLDIFIRDGLCPNKCGLLRRRVMDCVSCRYKTYICLSPSGQQDCGDFTSMNRAGTEYSNEFNLFLKTPHSGPFEGSQVMKKSKRILEKHLDIFIRDEKKDCPLEWWSSHSGAHEQLASLARKYLATPASTVQCERLFSVAGHNVQKKRSALLSENVNTLVCLTNWLKED